MNDMNGPSALKTHKYKWNQNVIKVCYVGEISAALTVDVINTNSEQNVSSFLDYERVIYNAVQNENTGMAAQAKA